MRALAAELVVLRERIRLGGGSERAEKQHAQGKLTVRERVTGLLDPDEPWVEVGLLVAHDLYDGQAPAAGVITGVGRMHGREVVVVANDATVKAGSWWPETIAKMLRAQEIAMRCRVPIIYLVDSAGVNLPYQGGVFPGQYGAARLFYYNSIMRRYLRVPQLGGRDGAVHRWRRLSPGAVRRDRHGRGHELHGTRRAQPREGRHRAHGGRRVARRGAGSHRGVGCGPLRRPRRPRGPAQTSGSGARATPRLLTHKLLHREGPKA